MRWRVKAGWIRRSGPGRKRSPSACAMAKCRSRARITSTPSACAWGLPVRTSATPFPWDCRNQACHGFPWTRKSNANALDERVEAVVNRGERDGRHLRPSRGQTLFRDRVVAFGRGSPGRPLRAGAWGADRCRRGAATRSVLWSGGNHCMLKENWNRSNCK